MSPPFIAKPFCFPNVTFRFTISLGFLALSQLCLPVAILFKSWSVHSSLTTRGDVAQTNLKPPLVPTGSPGRMTWGTDGLDQFQVLGRPGGEAGPWPAPACRRGPAAWEGEWILSQQRHVKEVPTPGTVPGKRLQEGGFQSHLNMGGR